MTRSSPVSFCQDFECDFTCPVLHLSCCVSRKASSGSLLVIPLSDGGFDPILGPGPGKYNRCPCTGIKNHDCTKYAEPAYTMRVKSSPKSKQGKGFWILKKLIKDSYGFMLIMNACVLITIPSKLYLYCAICIPETLPCFQAQNEQNSGDLWSKLLCSFLKSLHLNRSDGPGWKLNSVILNFIAKIKTGLWGFKRPSPEANKQC